MGNVAFEHRLVINPDQRQGDQIILTPGQKHYLYHVLRLGPGAQILLMDGQGQAWLSVLYPAWAEILGPYTPQGELPVAVTLMIAIPKGNGLEEVLRQATELGVRYVSPVVSERTIARPSPGRQERWQRLVQETAQQCERSYVPTLGAPVSWSVALTQLPAQTPAYLCTPRIAGPLLLDLLIAEVSRPELPPALIIAVGPEGGWTPAETDQAQAAGFRLASLGGRILRTVTAPLAALALVAAVLEGGGGARRPRG